MKYTDQNFSDFYSIFAVSQDSKWIVASVEEYEFAKKIARKYFLENKKEKCLVKIYVRKTFGVICYEFK